MVIESVTEQLRTALENAQEILEDLSAFYVEIGNESFDETETIEKEVQKAIETRQNAIKVRASKTVNINKSLWENTLFRPFVANRIGEIQMFTEPSQWQHVFTEENPADLCTRGATPSELADSPLWWNGPDWLTKDFKEWSKMQDPNRPREMPERKTSQRKEDTNGCTTLLTSNLQKEAASKQDDKQGVWRLDPKRFSSWIRLLRVHARVRRVLLNMRRRDNRNARMELLPEEIKDAEEEIVRLAQREAFCEEYTALKISSVCKCAFANFMYFLPRHTIWRRK